MGALDSDFNASLALYTDDTYGDIQKDGSVKPTYTKHLVWAYVSVGEYDQSGAGAGGVLPDGGPMTAKVPAGTTCTGVWLADAASGEYLMGYSSCPFEK